MSEIVEPSFVKIAENLEGAEGPVFDKHGSFYMVAPLGRDNSEKKPEGDVLKVDVESGKVDILCSPQDGDRGGIPAGCQCDLDNNIWIADMALGILRMDTSGKYQQMFKEDSSGRTMQGCNDCAFDYDGNLWVTAPAGDIAPAELKRSFEEPFGSVYCLTKDQKLVRIEGNLRFPNGIAVLHTDDGKPSKLIVAETPTKLLWQYDIKGPGEVGERSIWGKLPGDHEGGPDGMDFDEHNNLIVANWGGGHLEVFCSTGGDPVTRIKCPFDKPSNVHFKPGSSTVFVTEHQFNGLWKFEWKHKGKKQYCETK
ncbi:diisopropyl-fluorophosphatase-like [Mercenaria mercenaria]|uniref:diisopropyl-fluorophosphatase-like n=1 Tax=Mercenaria mercenaria TaxID=6596 RepID=UPI001E1DFF0D|nr:diisopropyl-fluorophosphatase-like [Mercenaria mercenaria]